MNPKHADPYPSTPTPKAPHERYNPRDSAAPGRRYPCECPRRGGGGPRHFAIHGNPSPGERLRCGGGGPRGCRWVIRRGGPRERPRPARRSSPREDRSSRDERPPRDEKDMLYLDEWKKLFEEGYQSPSNREGKVVRGPVEAITEAFVLVGLGEGPVGQIPIEELRRADGSLAVAVGEEVSALVERVESARVVLSKEKAERAQRWEEAWSGLSEGATVEGVVAARVKGGLSVEVNGLRAFLPGSQVDVRPVRDLDPFVGRRLSFQIIKLDVRRGDLVLSRRTQAEQQRNEQKRQVRTDLQEGAVVEGTVKSLAEYGAFVELGGVDGLLAIPNMSWGRVKSPADLYKVGDVIQVKILKIDPANGKIALGTKQLSPDPWAGAVERFRSGPR